MCAGFIVDLVTDALLKFRSINQYLRDALVPIDKRWDMGLRNSYDLLHALTNLIGEYVSEHVRNLLYIVILFSLSNYSINMVEVINNMHPKIKS